MKQNKIWLELGIIIPSLFVIILYSCSPSNIQGGSNIERYNLGKASDYDVSTTLPRILQAYQFLIHDNYMSTDFTSIDTEWKHRYPYEDEKEQGIIEGRIRLIFRIRKTSDDLNYVQLEAENHVKNTEGTDWQNAPLSNMLKVNLSKMVDELKQEFEEGRLRR